MKTKFCLMLVCLFLAFCTQAQNFYFPKPNQDWSSVLPAQVGWSDTELQKALDFAMSQQSTSVMILHRGKILAQRHMPSTDRPAGWFNRAKPTINQAGHVIEDVASIQKSVVAILVGIAQQKGLLNTEDKVSQYLKMGWSKSTQAHENTITLQHLMTMTSGLNTRLKFHAPAGTKWLYNTQAYAHIMDVLVVASGMGRHQLTHTWLTQPLGMNDSKWVERGLIAKRTGNAYGFISSAHDLAKLGLLMLAGGQWAEKTILTDQAYLKQSTHSSQTLNPFYGWLWWVNQNSLSKFQPVGLEALPPDAFAAKGANNKLCVIIPSLNLVVVRLGRQPDEGEKFEHTFFTKLMAASSSVQ